MALTTVKSDQIQTSVALAGSPTTTTQSASDNSTKIATTAYADTAVANLVASAPSALNTLDELAAALNDDASFSTTITNSIATKLPLAGGTMSGALNMGSQNITNAGTIAGTLTTAAQTNITSVGTLTGLTSSGSIQTTGSATKFVSNSSSSGDYIRIYAGSGTGKWDIYGNGANLRFSDNDSAGIVAFDTAATFGGTGTFAGGAANNNDDANILTLNASQHARLLVDTSSTSGHRATLALESNGNELTLGTTGSASYLTSVGNLEITGGLVGIGRTPAFASLEIEGDKTLANNLQLQINGATNTNKQLILGYDTSTDESHIISQLAGSALKPLILSASAVGIGASTMTPTSALHVDKSHTGTLVTFHQTAGNSSADRGLDVETSSTGTTVQRWLNSGSELARITGSGNVGIGVNPTHKLHVKNDNDYAAKFGGTGGGDYSIEIGQGSTNSSAGFNATGSGGSMLFKVQDTEYMRIKADGNVGIGTNNPYTKLQVEGTVSDTYTPTAFLDKQQVRIRHPNASNNYGGIGFTNAAGNYEWFVGTNQTSASPAIADFVFQGADSTSGYTENMRIDCGGHVTMPRQPYVQGRGNGGWAAFNASASFQLEPHSNSPVTSVDRNSDYSTTNKRFTCPVDGVYLVCASWYIYQTAAAAAGTQYLHPAVYKNGGIAWNGSMQPYTIVGHEIDRSGTGSKHYDGVQITFTVYCSANDYLDIRAYTPNANTQSYENYHYFSYTLLS